MDNVEIRSYMQQDVPKQNNIRQPTKRVTTMASNLNLPSTGLRRPESYGSGSVQSAQPIEAGIRPSVRHSNRVSYGKRPTIQSGGFNTSKPVSTVRHAAVNKEPVNWTSSLRSSNTPIGMNDSRPTPVLQENRTEHALRNEIDRLRTSFETFRNDCYKRMENILATNASLTEDLGDLKKQLDTTNSRLAEIACLVRGGTRKSLTMADVNTSKLLDELSVKLMQTPNFKDVVLGLIEEREQKLVEEEEEIDILLKPPCKANMSARLVPKCLTPTEDIEYISPPRQKTTIRDESCVNLDETIDPFEDVDDYHSSPRRQAASNETEDAARALSPHISLHFDPEISHRDDCDLNRTFTISDCDDEEDETKVRTSPAVLNRPYIDDKQSATRDRTDEPGPLVNVVNNAHFRARYLDRQQNTSSLWAHD